MMMVSETIFISSAVILSMSLMFRSLPNNHETLRNIHPSLSQTCGC